MLQIAKATGSVAFPGAKGSVNAPKLAPTLASTTPFAFSYNEAAAVSSVSPPSSSSSLSLSSDFHSDVHPGTEVCLEPGSGTATSVDVDLNDLLDTFKSLAETIPFEMEPIFAALRDHQQSFPCVATEH